MEILPILNQSAAAVSKSLVNCGGCTTCCERGGLVYLQEHEVSALSDKGIPILRVGGIPFIKRLPDGSCPMLDKVHRKCSIYEDRPLCCRLFPLDVLAVKGDLKWGVSDICPKDRRRFTPSESGSTSALGTGSLVRITSMLNGLISQEAVGFIRAKEMACSSVQKLEEPADRWTVLGQFEPAREGTPSLELGHKETKKEKFWKKLKEKKKKKKKKKKKHH